MKEADSPIGENDEMSVTSEYLIWNVCDIDQIKQLSNLIVNVGKHQQSASIQRDHQLRVDTREPDTMIIISIRF